MYDDYGNLCFVLPPAATDNLSLLLQTGELPDGEACRIMLDKYAYQYRYDYRNRCVAKKFSGCDWQEMIYDTADRLIFSRDGNQRKRHEWSFQLSDSSERSVLSGIYHGTLNAASYEAFNVYASFKPENASTLYGYVLHYPAEINPDSLEVLKANYYDTYDYKEHLSGFNASLEYVEDENYGKQYADIANLHCKGLITGSMTSTLESGEELYGCYYYDYNRNLIQSRQTTLNGITLVDKSSFNFSGNPTATCEKYGNDITLCKAYTYDHAGRLTCENHVCENDTTAFLYSFDEIGRMKSLTRINGKDSLTTINSYNIRDWLTGIDSPVFKQSLHYTDGAGTPCYNGNVSSMTWQTDTLTTRGYKFSYDGLSRLKDANYGEGSSLTDNSNRFDEQVTAYDKMGNILGLKRYGQTSASAYGLIDDLSLSYDGNQLQTVIDRSASSAYANGFEFKDGANENMEYSYDDNGNLKQDLNKKITDIQYNCLNLPSRIEFGDGNSISYLYDANGTKLRTTHVIRNDTTVTDYCGNVVYENGVLHKLLTEYGYVTLADTAYHYFLQDHQGNNRVVVNQNGTVEEVNHYYPFGGIFASTSSLQPYKYNSKELDRKGGLDWYDYGARMYDAALGRWHVVDPLSGHYYSLSPYSYCINNPINLIDPDGNEPEIIVDLPQITIIGQKVAEPISGLWNTIGYYLLGRTITLPIYGINDNAISTNPIAYITYNVNKEGVATKIAPIGGIAPTPSFTGPKIKEILQLLKAGRAMTKGGLTVVGRALKKHGDRSGSAFPKAIGNPVAINQQGETLLKTILEHPNVQRVVNDATQTLKVNRYGANSVDYKIPGGIGARFSSDGNFITFLEP